MASAETEHRQLAVVLDCYLQQSCDALAGQATDGQQQRMALALASLLCCATSLTTAYGWTESRQHCDGDC